MNRISPARIALTLILGCFAIAPSVLAQAASGPIPVPPRGQSKPSEQKPSTGRVEQVIRARANLVSTPVTVEDSRGEMVLNLTQTDFHIFDNGDEQSISHFDVGSEPLSTVLVAETSSRVEPLLPAIRRAGIVFSQTVMALTGKAAVIGFDDDVALLQPFTRSGDAVQSAINHLPEGGSGARLYDALDDAVSLLDEQPENRRRVIVVIAESTDSGSDAKLGEVLRRAQLANVTIYSIGLSSTAAAFRGKPEQTGPSPISPPGTFPLPQIPGVPQTPDTQAAGQGNINLLGLAIWIVQHAAADLLRHQLEVASTATGGFYVHTHRDKTIQKALDKIGGELHAQYVVDYRPQGEATVGYHEIRVTVDRPKMSVRARPGYYLSSE